MLQVSWATAGQDRSQCCLSKAKYTTGVQMKDRAFMGGQTQRAAAQGLEFRDIHMSAAMRLGSKWQKVITKGTFHCTGSGGLSAREGEGWKYPAHQKNSRFLLTWAHIDVQHLHREQALFSTGSKPADSLRPSADCSVPNPKALCSFPHKSCCNVYLLGKSHSQDLTQPTPLPQLLLCNYFDHFSHLQTLLRNNVRPAELVNR